MCGLAWRVRRPLQLEIVDMREAKLEEGAVAVSFSSKSNEEASSCGVDGGMVANRRVCCRAFTMGTGLGPEGSGPTVDGWRSQGCGAEEDFGGLAGSESVDRERARTLKLSTKSQTNSNNSTVGIIYLISYGNGHREGVGVGGAGVGAGGTSVSAFIDFSILEVPK